MRLNRLLSTIFLFLSFTVCFAAEKAGFAEHFSSLKGWHIVNGKWKVDSRGRLLQTDTKANITHIYRKVEQSGLIDYEFETGYIKGLEDEYGGFGCHILIDKPTKTKSWGVNKSFLFWFTYDKYAYKSKQFYFQIYKSSGPRTMTIIHDARQYPLPLEYLNVRAFKADKSFTSPVKISFSIDTTNGKGTLNFPTGSVNGGIEFDIKDILPEGHYFSFRTNNMAVMFDNLEITARPSPENAAAVLKNADLSGLEVSRGILTPPFAEDITDYTLAVDSTVSQISITPAAHGMVTVNDEIVLSRKPSGDIRIHKGGTRVKILVTAADAATTREYTVSVIRIQEAGDLLADNLFPGTPLLFSSLGQ